MSSTLRHSTYCHPRESGDPEYLALGFTQGFVYLLPQNIL